MEKNSVHRASDPDREKAFHSTVVSNGLLTADSVLIVLSIKTLKVKEHLLSG